ncbi:MAG: hypothetical protein IJH86_10590 [Clostridia bacterium]|nr:hypothetical protein [Clostridia bacterium]
MSIYHKTLRWIGTALIVIASVELVLLLLLIIGVIFAKEPELQSEIGNINTAFAFAFLEVVIDMSAGLLSRLFYQKEGRIRLLFHLENLIFLAMVGLIVFDGNTKGVNSFRATPALLTFMVIYTIMQMTRNEKNWQRICNSTPVSLDLRLDETGKWFDPLVIGPHLELNTSVSDSVDRFLSTQRKPRPLLIVLHGLGRVSEPMQETMRDIFQEHYDDEMRRVSHYLERRYLRLIILLCVSIVALEVWIKMNGPRHVNTVETVLSNLAAFSLWQVGSTFIERTEVYEELLRMTIAKIADIRFM